MSLGRKRVGAYYADGPSEEEREGEKEGENKEEGELEGTERASCVLAPMHRLLTNSRKELALFRLENIGDGVEWWWNSGVVERQSGEVTKGWS